MPAYTFHFFVLGRYPARIRGNESAVTVNVAAGPEGHLTHAGTLTLSEAEWDHFVNGLRKGLGDALEIEERADR